MISTEPPANGLLFRVTDFKAVLSELVERDKSPSTNYGIIY